MPYYGRRDLFTSVENSLATSGITSEVYNIEGVVDCTLFVVASNSTLTVQVSNDNGRTAAITNWSTVSTVLDDNVLYVTPGPAWIRCLRSNSSEPSEVILGAWYNTQ